MHKLIHHPLCPFSRSIRLALGECGIVAELHEERPWSWRPELLELNPAGTLPVMLLDGGPILCGVYAAAEYLAEADAISGGAPPRGILLPGSRGDRAEIRRLIDWFHRKFADEVSQYLLDEKVFRIFSRDTGHADPSIFRAGRQNLRYHLSYISYLADHRRWLGGSNLSFADLAAAGHLSALDYLGEVPWEEFQPAKEWYARVKSRPSFRPLLADRVPGLQPPAVYADLDF